MFALSGLRMAEGLVVIDLPAGWAATILGDVCLPLKKVRPEDVPTQAFTYLDITCIDNSTFRIDTPKAYLGKDAPSRARQEVHTGNILFSTVRTYLKNIALVPPEYDAQVASTGFCVLNPSREIDSRLVFYYVQNDEFITRLNPIQRGTSYPAVRDSDVLGQNIPLPPIAEQRRMVAEIETQFTRLDASVAALRRAQANLKRYRASILKAACEGSLVPTEAELARSEGRDYDPASVLLERILAERRSRWESQEKRRGKYKESSAPDTSDLPDLPEGWVWANLDQLIYLLEGGTAVTATSTASSRKVLRSSAVRHGFIDLDDHRYLPEDAITSSDPYLASGDLLFTRLSGTLEYVGNCAVVGELGDQNIEFPDRIFRGRCTSSASPHYIQNCFSTQILRQDLEAKAKSSAGHQRISLSDLREFRMPLPPLGEQHRIVADVERRLSVVQQAEATVEASLVRAEWLRQSILKQAFTGRLVPQDPDDEPASVLLERIKAEREAKMQASVTGKGKSGAKKANRDVSHSDFTETPPQKRS